MTNLKQLANRYRADFAILAALVAVSLTVRILALLSYLQAYPVISADGVGYAQIARSLFKEGGLSSASYFPPFYPFLVALVDLCIKDTELAGRLVSLLMGSLVVVPLYLLGRRFFSRNAAVIACLFAASWPSLMSLSLEVLTQQTYLVLLLAALYLLVVAADKGAGFIAVAAGLAMGFAYLTRPEAFIVFVAASPFIGLYIQANGGTRREIGTVLLFAWLAFWVMAFPYILLLYKVNGTWQLTAKTTMTLWISLGQYLGKFDVYREIDAKAIGYWEVIRDYPGFIPYNIAKNLREISEEFLTLPCWALACIGFIVGGWSKSRLAERFFLLSTVAPLLVIVVFFLAGSGYTQLSLPAFLLWIGNGAVATEGWLAQRLPARINTVMQRGLVSLLVCMALFANTLWAHIPRGGTNSYFPEQDGGRYDHKKIGLLLRENLPSDAKIMTRSSRISFYSGLPTAYIPQSNLASTIANARENKVRFLIVDGSLEQLRPQLELLFLPLRIGPDNVLRFTFPYEYQPIPGVRLYLIYRHPASQGVAVYELVG